MIPRYNDPNIAPIWTDAAKLERWDDVELAAVQAGVAMGEVKEGEYAAINQALADHPADIEWWLKRDGEINHDLNAYLDERRRHIPVELQHLYHKGMTSYDTEEAAFAQALIDSSKIVRKASEELLEEQRFGALKYRYLPFFDRTHGQGAKLRSFGGRVLTWRAELLSANTKLVQAMEGLRYSRLSGAQGNYGGLLTPELEKRALEILGFKPFHGATQIIPRVVYTPLAQALVLVAGAVNKMATDIRLGARTPWPICQEPFGKKQKGSSAMPHKKNTILTEQMEGMERMIRGYCNMLEEGSKTWEGRAIEQSCVERVAWPDIFHTVMRMLTVMKRVVAGLVIYPDNMLREIIESRGTYASDEAKNFLAEELGKCGIDAEIAYRIIQLASFCVFEPSRKRRDLRGTRPQKLEDMDALMNQAAALPAEAADTIEKLVCRGELRPVAELEATAEDVRGWNSILKDIFTDRGTLLAWEQIFKPSQLLRQEAFLYERLT